MITYIKNLIRRRQDHALDDIQSPISRKAVKKIFQSIGKGKVGKE